VNEDPIAAFDQGLKGLRDIAKATWACYESHVEQGFNKRQASEIAKAWFLQATKQDPE
jgi:hypothetical protein